MRAKKTVLKVVLVLMTLFVAAMFLAACNEKANYSDLYDLGTYNNYNVVIRKYENKDVNTNEVVVDVYVGETYICSLPNTAYKIVVLTNGGDGVSLQKAYENGYITDNDLVSISQKGREATKLNPAEE
jgi:hypothetical protein